MAIQGVMHAGIGTWLMQTEILCLNLRRIAQDVETGHHMLHPFPGREGRDVLQRNDNCLSNAHLCKELLRLHHMYTVHLANR